MPRSYRSEKRRAAADETRARIVTGARELLLSEDGYRRFTMDAIARHTNVARMTVYYQFESKAGIFEALADDIAERSAIRTNLEAAFREPEAGRAVRGLIAAFVRLWLADAEVMRKLNALSMLDSQSHAAERDAWRLQAIDRMMARVKRERKLSARAAAAATDALKMLTAFGPCDTLARQGRPQRAIAQRIGELVEAAAGVPLTN